MRWIVVGMLCLALGACGDPLFSSSDNRYFGRDVAVPEGCHRGKLTAEGNTCQAMRAEDGMLLTLGGALRGFAPGDRVCVCGFPADKPFCRQGRTIIIREIAARCADIR